MRYRYLVTKSDCEAMNLTWLKNLNTLVIRNISVARKRVFVIYATYSKAKLQSFSADAATESFAFSPRMIHNQHWPWNIKEKGVT